MVQKMNLLLVRRQVIKLIEIFNVVGTLIIKPTWENSALSVLNQWRRVQDIDVLDRGAFLLQIIVELYSFFDANREKEEKVSNMFYIYIPLLKDCWKKSENIECCPNLIN